MPDAKLFRIAAPLFAALEGLLYAAFLSLDLLDLSGHTIFLKYGGILLCLLFSLLCCLRGGPKLLPCALALTAVADLFLLVLNRCYGLGVSVFLCVQALYAVHLCLQGGSHALWLRLALALACILTVCLAGLISPLNLLAALYFSQLLTNAILAWTLPGRARRLFALGLSLFIGCDLCVGLFNIAPLLSPGLSRFAAIGMWLFYLPSQVLIALSALPKKRCFPS